MEHSGLKLLFDQNLSESLIEAVSTEFSGATHVRGLGLERSEDARVWEHARVNGCAIVTKDNDFDHLATTRGHPPKVIRLQLGNCTTHRAARALLDNAARIREFLADHDRALLVLQSHE